MDLCIRSNACASGGLDCTPFCTAKCRLPHSPPPLFTVTLVQLRMLFQSTHEDRQGAEAPAEPGDRIAKSTLQRTLTAHIMGRWAKHEGALAHISLKRSIEMLELHCAQRFPTRPLTLIILFSQSFFLPLSPNPHSLTCLR